VIWLSCSTRTNRLVDALPPEARQRWLPRMQRVVLPQGLALHDAGRRMEFVYFPTTAVVSLVSDTQDGAGVAFALVGQEGIVGVELLLGGGSMPSRAVVQTAGEALRLPAQVIHDEVARGGAATHLMLRYTMALMAQVGQTAVCNRHHALEQRLCCWLLRTLDRLQGHEVVATQEQIAHMLGVRRESVTDAALRLHSLGLIRCVRGRILVLDRDGLEKRSCECYAVVKNEYDRLLPLTVGSAPPRSSPAAVPAQTAAPNKAPTPAVIAMANAPQKQTRHAPARTLAPPARAATAPNRARKASDVPAVHAINPGPGTIAVTARGNRAPTAKLAADASAA
jgi:CRP-like cAMP-binding protein